MVERSLLSRLRDGVANLLTGGERTPIRLPVAPAEEPRQAPVPQPIGVIREVMEKRLAGATIGGVRQAVGMHVTNGLRPEDLAVLLREAEDGDPEAYLALAEEIEEKDLHYRSVLNTRKLQVAQLDQTVEAASEEALDKAIAADVQTAFLDSGLLDDRVIFDMMDAIGKGFSVMEVMWELDGSAWDVDRLEWCDPRFFTFDRATRRFPLRREDNGQRVPLEPFKFVVCFIAGKSGIPIRGGLARAACWAWMFKTFAIKDWVQFCEVYGMPFRLGKYAPGTSPSDIQSLLRSVLALASDAGAAIPNNMDISLLEQKGVSSDGGVFSSLAKYFDDQMSKAVLGQTGTTDATPGKLGGTNEHQLVREDIERADAKELMGCINRQLVQPYVQFKYGPQRKYPWIWIGRPEAKDAAMMVDAAAKLAGMMPIRADDIRQAVGFTKPNATDEVLKAPSAAAPTTGNIIPPADLNVSLNAARTYVELLAAELEPEGDAIARAAREQGDNVMTGVEKQILHTYSISRDENDFRRRLMAARDTLDLTPLADHLALLTFQALAGGITGEALSNKNQ